jgi:hypothetical protein
VFDRREQRVGPAVARIAEEVWVDPFVKETLSLLPVAARDGGKKFDGLGRSHGVIFFFKDTIETCSFVYCFFWFSL